MLMNIAYCLGSALKKRYPYLPYFLVVVSGFSTDVYMPSMPSMMKAYNVAMSDIQYSITFYVIGLGVSQLIAGPITDALGRRRLMLTSMLLQILTIIALLSINVIYFLCGARLIQGLAMGFLSVPCRAILNDCYSGDELKKKYTTMTTAFGLAPIIAPFVGGIAESVYGWQLSFMVVLAYIIAAFGYVFFYYQETLAEPSPVKFLSSLEKYKTLFKHKHFMLSTMLICFMSTYNYVVTTMGPFLFQHRFHLSALVYGNIALTIGLGWFLGNYISRLLYQIPLMTRCVMSLVVQTLLIIAYLLIANFKMASPFLLVVIFFIFSLSSSFVFGAVVSEALSLFPKLAGSANGVLFSFLWVFFGLSSFVASLLPIDNLLPMALVFLVNYSICILLAKNLMTHLNK
jgi:MFS transporter, DHA1 family, multidrug resistance protein